MSPKTHHSKSPRRRRRLQLRRACRLEASPKPPLLSSLEAGAGDSRPKQVTTTTTTTTTKAPRLRLRLRQGNQQDHGAAVQEESAHKPLRRKAKIQLRRATTQYHDHDQQQEKKKKNKMKKKKKMMMMMNTVVKMPQGPTTDEISRREARDAIVSAFVAFHRTAMIDWRSRHHQEQQQQEQEQEQDQERDQERDQIERGRRQLSRGKHLPRREVLFGMLPKLYTKF